MAAETRRNEYTSLKKNVRQTHTPLLADSQQIKRLDDVQTTEQHLERMSSPPLDSTVQKSREEPSMSNKLPIKVDVSVKIVPKIPKIDPKTKNNATDVD